MCSRRLSAISSDMAKRLVEHHWCKKELQSVECTFKKQKQNFKQKARFPLHHAARWLSPAFSQPSTEYRLLFHKENERVGFSSAH